MNIGTKYLTTTEVIVDNSNESLSLALLNNVESSMLCNNTIAELSGLQKLVSNLDAVAQAVEEFGVTPAITTILGSEFNTISEGYAAKDKEEVLSDLVMTTENLGKRILAVIKNLIKQIVASIKALLNSFKIIEKWIDKELTRISKINTPVWKDIKIPWQVPDYINAPDILRLEMIGMQFVEDIGKLCTIKNWDGADAIDKNFTEIDIHKYIVQSKLFKAQVASDLNVLTAYNDAITTADNIKNILKTLKQYEVLFSKVKIDKLTNIEGMELTPVEGITRCVMFIIAYTNYLTIEKKGILLMLTNIK